MAWQGTINPNASFSNATPITGGSSSQSINHPAAGISLANGTGANQINSAWLDTRSYAATPTTHDLRTLAAAATNTGAATLSAIKFLRVFNNGANAITVNGGSPATPFLGGLASVVAITIDPGGYRDFCNPTAAGWATAGAYNLKIDPGANTVSVTIVVAGLA